MRNGHASMGRKRYLWRAVIGNFFCLLATASASEPTLQESIDFIRTKVHGRSCEYKTGSPQDYTTRRYYGYTITLLDNKTILVKGTLNRRRVRIAPEGKSFYRDDGFAAHSVENILLVPWTVKVRLADLSTDVEVNIPGKAARDVTARDIVVNCTKPACLEWKEPNNTETEIRVASVIEADPDRRSESRRPARQGSASDFSLLTICDQKDAEKIKKALTHAIRISGGKGELF